MNILLVEDISDVAEIITEELQAAGHLVVSKGSIEEADRYLENSTPHCIIVDGCLPFDGLTPEEKNRCFSAHDTGPVWVERLCTTGGLMGRVILLQDPIPDYGVLQQMYTQGLLISKSPPERLLAALQVVRENLKR